MLRHTDMETIAVKEKFLLHSQSPRNIRHSVQCRATLRQISGQVGMGGRDVEPHAGAFIVVLEESNRLGQGRGLSSFRIGWFESFQWAQGHRGCLSLVAWYLALG